MLARSYEPSTLRPSNRTNTENFLGFCLQVFRQVGPPQRVDCLAHKRCLDEISDKAYPVLTQFFQLLLILQGIAQDLENTNALSLFIEKLVVIFLEVEFKQENTLSNTADKCSLKET